MTALVFHGPGPGHPARQDVPGPGIEDASDATARVGSVTICDREGSYGVLLGGDRHDAVRPRVDEGA